MSEPSYQFGSEKYVLAMILGVILISAGSIISTSRIYVSSASDTYDHLTFASSITGQLGTMFVTLPLLIGGIVRIDMPVWVRVVMVIIGGLLLGARFA